MEPYLFHITRRPDGGRTCTCEAFNIAVDADNAEDALKGCRRLCEEKGRNLLLAGNPLPEGISDLNDLEDDDIRIVSEFDLTEQYRKEFSQPVRRNISLPEWMDRQLRRRDIDASRLFQAAAEAKLRETESGMRKITDSRDLPDACAPGVLEDYVEHAILKLLRKKED